MPTDVPCACCLSLRTKSSGWDSVRRNHLRRPRYDPHTIRSHGTIKCRRAPCEPICPRRNGDVLRAQRADVTEDVQAVRGPLPTAGLGMTEGDLLDVQRRDMPVLCSVVVTYNRKELLIRCINALLAQTYSLAQIIIVDNDSTDGTKDELERNGMLEHSSLIYMRLDKNRGGAGGFACGMKRALFGPCDYIWLMDDDVLPDARAAELMLPYFSGPGVAAVSNLKLDPTGTVIPHIGMYDPMASLGGIRYCDNMRQLHDGMPIDFSSFVGLAVSCDAVRRVGVPNERLFLHWDDAEYCWRLRRAGAIVLSLHSVVIHYAAARRFEHITRRVLGKEVELRSVDAMLKQWYFARNEVWFSLRRHDATGIALRQLATRYAREAAAIALAGDCKSLRMWWLFTALFQGITGRFDNSVPQRMAARRTTTK
jgi:rhamnopyranosyl-N-acetylglucosaminyl-diphospho-decaprenol beta-1,3/1,4-galactofuranosyltransferase